MTKQFCDRCQKEMTRGVDVRFTLYGRDCTTVDRSLELCAGCALSVEAQLNEIIRSLPPPPDRGGGGGIEPSSAPKNEWRLDSDGLLDDVIVEDVQTFRLERMSDDHVWGAVYRRDGSRTDFNLYGDRLSLDFEHETTSPPKGTIP